MPERVPFCRIKLQYLAEAATDAELDDNAFRVISYLSLIHADHETGEARPSFATIGDAIGKHAKSVKRALQKAEDAGYLKIERGTNFGNSSRYRPTDAAQNRAIKRRKEREKIVPLSRSKGGQKCPVRRTNLSGRGGQICPPNLDQELKERAREGELVFVPASSKAAQEWQDLCDRHLGSRLVHLVGEVGQLGKGGYLLPSYWPPTDRAEWPAMARYLQALGTGQERQASHA